MERTDVQFVLRVFRIGVRVSLGAAFASAFYLLATPEGANRTVLLLCSLLIAADAIAISRLPQRRIIESGRAILVFGVWNAVHVVGIGFHAALDGPGTPYLGFLWVSAAFAAVCLPGRAVAAITLLDVVALVLLDALHGGLEPAALVLQCAALVATAAVCSTLANDRRRQVATLRHHNREIVRRLALVVEHRDHDTGGHIERIGAYAAIVGDELGLPLLDCEELELAATLHDVGKVGIADAILLKPGRLTADERTEMERHAQIGFEMLSGSGMDVLDAAAEIALSHHERFDGAGYPRGLSGTDIPLTGRIVAVADVFDALTSDRVYKAAMDFDEALAIIRDGAGTQFDPAVVDAFVARLSCVRRVHAALRPSAAPAPAPAPAAPAPPALQVA